MSRPRLSFVSIVPAASLSVAGPSVVASGPDPVFTEITEVTGIGLDVLHESVAWGDYDNDGDQDLYITGDAPNRLFRNDGGDVFTDVTDAAGVGNALFSVGTAFADLDNDGDLDLYVVNFQAGSDALYRNDGDGTFTDIAQQAGIVNTDSSRGMAFADVDRDGLLDIYVNAIGPDMLYRNLGGLQFEQVQDEIGIDGPNVFGQGVGVVATDINHDGWIDLFTGNRSDDVNALFLNQGDGTFIDIATAAGIDKTGLGMGVLSFDYDNDLDMDLYWTSWPSVSNALYENIDGTTFIDVAEDSGTLDTTGWGISCNAGDVNNDGWEDMFVTNGFDPGTSANVLFVNNGDKTFTDATATLESGGLFDGRGVAFADYDNDGDVDLVVTSDAPEPNRFWRNDSVTANRWVTFTLEGSCSNRSAIGARIEVTTDVRTTVKEVSGGAGRGSFNSLPVEFGLGQAREIQAVSIRWPNGLEQDLDPRSVAIDAFNSVVEPVKADMNMDGELNVFDFIAFQQAFQNGKGIADVNGDGELNVFDFTAYQELFAGGGC